ncbi:putative adhesin [Actinocrispum sp. NPDC049592]|uniref:putative adhesin n=1 Tax=Actinocrispum sp. NPDC049592 TaxID=3154835 RepID=UPI00341D055E
MLSSLLLPLVLVLGLVMVTTPRAVAGPAVAPPGAGPVESPAPETSRPRQVPGVHAPDDLSTPKPNRVGGEREPRSEARSAVAAGPGTTDVYLAPGYIENNASLVVYFNMPDPNFQRLYMDLLDPAGNPVDFYYVSFFPEDLNNHLLCPERTKYCYVLTSAPWAGWQAAPIKPGSSYKLRLSTSYGSGSYVDVMSNVATVRPLPAVPGVSKDQVPGCGCPNSAGQTAAVQGLGGDPVNTATGAYTENDTDLALPGFGVKFGLTRSYSSVAAGSSSLSQGWSWSYDMGLAVASSGDVTFRAEDGSKYLYRKNSDGTYAAPPGARSVLALVSGEYRLTTPEQTTLVFGTDGLLRSQVDQRGNGLRFTNANGKLASVTDAAGRVVAFSFDGNGKLTRATLPDGRYVEYGYTGGRLVSARDTAGGTTKYEYDTAGRLTKVTDGNNHAKVTNTYDAASGRVTKQVDAGGGTTTYGWDQAKQEARVTDPDGVVSVYGYTNGVAQYLVDGNGARTSFRYDARLDLVLVVDPLGRQTEMTYDTAGNVLTRKSLDTGVTESFTYDSGNRETSHVDGRGNRTSTTYGSFGEKTTATDAEGKVTTYGYDTRGLLTSVTDPLNQVTVQEYDAAGNNTATKAPSGARTTYGYDGSGRRTSTTDARNAATTFVYDAKDRFIATTDPLGHAVSVTYDAVGNTRTVTDARGKVTTYGYDEMDRQTSVTDPLGRVSATTYTKAGRKASEANPNGERTSFAYDAVGRLQKQTTPRGTTTTFEYDWAGNKTAESRPYPGGGTATTRTTYDALNRPVTVTDPLGKISKTDYDANGNVIAVTSPVGAVTKSEYDKNNRTTATVDARGKRWVSTLDALGRRTSQTTPLGRKTTYGYNADGELTSTVDPAGKTTTYDYDQVGHRVATTDPVGAVTRTEYDLAGQVVSSTNANGHVTRYGYDEVNRLVRVLGADAVDQATRYAYDDAGQLVSRTDPLGHVTTYAYDPAGRKSSTVDPLGRERRYGYDADGNQTSIVTARATTADPATGTITQQYDTLGRLTTVKLGSAGATHTFGYDAANRVTEASDPAGTQSRGYDDAGRLISVKRGTDTFGYTYDPAGNVTQRQYPNGTAIGIAFDDDSQPASQTQAGQPTTFTYDPAGRLQQIAYPGGQTETHGYDAAGRLSSVSNDRAGQVLSRFTRTLDPVGNPTSVATIRGPTTRTDTYTYDAAERLTGACAGTTSCTKYSYDLVGNRKTLERDGASTTYSYDNADQLTSVTAPGGAVTAYEYDRDGNQTKAGADTFGYDLANRLTTAKVGGKNVTLTYDTDANRLTSTVDGTASAYTWDINNSLPILATETSATVTRTFAYNAGQPLRLTTGGKSYFYGHDPLGGTSDLVSDAGIAQYSYDYEPFGTGPGADPQPLVQGAPANPLRYTGEYADGTTGLYNLRARQYSPGVGRFTSVDPVDPARDTPYPSPYLYTDDRPTTTVDPSGNCWWVPWSESGSGCPGREIRDAVVGFGKGVYNTAKGAVNAALHPIDTLKSAVESCWEGFKHSLYLGCLGNTTGVYQLFGVGQKCPPNWNTEDWADHITQVGLGIIMLGRGGVRGGGPTRGLSSSAGHVTGKGPWLDTYVVQGARPDGQTVFSGHGWWDRPDGYTTIPAGTSLRMYVRDGELLDDSIGLQVELGQNVKHVYTYGPGARIKNYTLGPSEGISAATGSYTVGVDTQLSQLLSPNLGLCHWAACREH